jgi:hypothetical protein
MRSACHGRLVVEIWKPFHNEKLETYQLQTNCSKRKVQPIASQFTRNIVYIARQLAGPEAQRLLIRQRN